MAYDASSEDRFSRDPDRVPRTRTARDAPHETNTSWYWLFVLPFVFLLFPFIYNTSSPELFGMPFFYWYQMLWIPLTAIITIGVYLKTRGGRDAR